MLRKSLALALAFGAMVSSVGAASENLTVSGVSSAVRSTHSSLEGKKREKFENVFAKSAIRSDVGRNMKKYSSVSFEAREGESRVDELVRRLEHIEGNLKQGAAKKLQSALKRVNNRLSRFKKRHKL